MIDATAAAAAAMLAEDAFDIVSERYCASDCARIAGTETPSCTTSVSPSRMMFRELRRPLGSREAEALGVRFRMRVKYRVRIIIRIRFKI